MRKNTIVLYHKKRENFSRKGWVPVEEVTTRVTRMKSQGSSQK